MGVNLQKLFLGMALLVMLASCAQSTTQNDTLAVAIQAEPITLDPRVASDAFGDKIGQLIFNGLFRKDESLQVVPDAATRYEQLSDTSYRVFLRRDIRFHNGDPLTAHDVVYTIRSILDGEVISPYKAAFSRIQTVVAEDDWTVRFDLSEPYAPFLTSLCRGIVPAKEAKRLKERFGREPVGTGPYRLVRWVDDSLIELEAVGGGEGPMLPKTRRIAFHVIKDDNVRVLKLIKGDLDLVLNGVPPVLLEKLKTDRRLVTRAETGTIMAYVGTNLTDKVLRDRRVRRAIALGIDRDELIRHRRYGFAEKADSILAPINWAYARDLVPLSYDPEAAKKLLDQAGFRDPDGPGPKKRFVLSFKTSTVKERIDIVQMIAGQLERIGVGIKVEPYEWGTFFSDVQKGNFQLYSLQWVGVTEPDIFFDVFHSRQTPPNGLNRGRYKNRALDQLVEEGRRTLDEEARKRIYAEVQRLVLEELPIIPLWYEQNILVYRKGLEGVSLWPDASFRSLVNIAKTGW